MSSWSELLSSSPLLMGIVNVTPDSFSDGGLFLSPQKAVCHAEELLLSGADIIDIGGESSRPFSEAVPLEEEMRRVIPVIKQVSIRMEALISIDTYKARVAEAAIKAGAKIVNDISALRFDKDMAKVVADYKVPVVLMHMKGTPKDMQLNPYYEDVLKEIYQFFEERIEFALKNGISEGQICLDPGIGFGKRLEDNLRILKHISYFKSLGFPILVGPSRKSFIGQILGIENPARRDIGTMGVIAYLVTQGVDIIRVHAVKECRQITDILHAILHID